MNIIHTNAVNFFRTGKKGKILSKDPAEEEASAA